MPEVRTQEHQLHYEVHGDGPPVVLLHSFLCSLEMWRPQIAPLCREHRVVAVDFRGHGQSSASQPHTLYDLVDDIVAVLDHLEIETAVWCGLSMGGMVSMRAALRAPDRVNALVLVDTDGGTERRPLRIQNRLLSMLTRIAGVRPVIPHVLTKMFCDRTLNTRPNLVETWTQHFLGLDLPSVRRSLSALSGRDDVLSALEAVECPALVIHGTQDRALPPRCGEKLAAALSNARHVSIEDAGHLPTLENPDAVTQAMLEFLKNNVSRRV